MRLVVRGKTSGAVPGISLGTGGGLSFPDAKASRSIFSHGGSIEGLGRVRVGGRILGWGYGAKLKITCSSVCKDVDRGRNICARGSVVLPPGSYNSYRGYILTKSDGIERPIIERGKNTGDNDIQASGHSYERAHHRRGAPIGPTETLQSGPLAYICFGGCLCEVDEIVHTRSSCHVDCGVRF